MLRKLIHNLILILVIGQIIAYPKIDINNVSNLSQKTEKSVQKNSTKLFKFSLSYLSIAEEIEEDSDDEINSEDFNLYHSTFESLNLSNLFSSKNHTPFSNLTNTFQKEKIFLMNCNFRI